MLSPRNAHQGVHKRNRDSVFSQCECGESIPSFQSPCDLQSAQIKADSKINDIDGSETDAAIGSQALDPCPVNRTMDDDVLKVNEVNLCSEPPSIAAHINSNDIPHTQHVKDDKKNKPEEILKCAPTKTDSPLKLDWKKRGHFFLPTELQMELLPQESLAGSRSGVHMICGRRREMEDTASIVPCFTKLQEAQAKISVMLNDLHFYGVFDGHGGSQASKYCMKRFHSVLAEESLANMWESEDERNSKWEEVMKATYLRIDKEVGGICPNGVRDDDESMDSGCTCCVDAVAPENVGTTAVVALVGSSQIVVANCGDSRALLVRGSNAIPLSRDHKPELEEETSRIEAAGGRVICWDGYRVGGLLALSRAIGDRYLKRYVISDPDVTCTPRTEDDECLILASDGLWDVLSNDLACEFARKFLSVLRKRYRSRPSVPGEDPVSTAVAQHLVKLAYTKGSKDNITVVVVDLKARSSS